MVNDFPTQLHLTFDSRAPLQPHHDVESIPVNAGVVEVGRPDVGKMVCPGFVDSFTRVGRGAFRKLKWR